MDGTAPESRRARFDLHVHTGERSPCAGVAAVDVLRLAAEQGLDGVVFTDHHQCWPEDELEEARRRAGVDLVVLSGQEITLFGVDYLVYGWNEVAAGFQTREEFVRTVHDGGGVVCVAHPYSILYYLDAETMASWKVDGVEVLNALKGGPTPPERRALCDYGLSEVGGSDFHRAVFPGRLGTCWTEIRGTVRSMADLVAAIREHRTLAVSEDDGP